MALGCSSSWLKETGIAFKSAGNPRNADEIPTLEEASDSRNWHEQTLQPRAVPDGRVAVLVLMGDRRAVMQQNLHG